MARTWLVLMCSLPLFAHAADDGRVSFLEQEVRNLQRQVLSLTRRVDQLERPLAPAPGQLPRAASATPASDAWIDSGRWRKLRPGMSELEVVELLGPPTSIREESGTRVLFYALEIGSSGFLGGSVRFRDKVVSEIRNPTLQ